MTDRSVPRIEDILESPSYRLAEEDPSFLESDEARASRLALEFMRADFYLREHRINSTVVVFGGSRIQPPDLARRALQDVQLGVASVADSSARTDFTRLQRNLEYSRYYDEARILAKVLAERSAGEHGHDFVVVTGGGPGIMEAANRGASEAGVPTIGFNIRLPRDQPPNPYITPSLAFRFHYFALRKMHFLLRARALVAFPGGYGTLDELFESLNLVQTKKIHPIPIILIGAHHWRRVIDFDYLVEECFIDPEERELATIVDTGEQAARIILDFYANDR